MSEELRDIVAQAIFNAEPNYDCLFDDDVHLMASMYRDADAAIDAVTPIVRKQMLLELIGKAKGTSGTICMWDGEGRDSFLTVAEWLNIYLAIEDED